MKLLAFHITGLNLYEHSGTTFTLHTIDAVRNPGYTHPLNKAAHNISISTVIGIAGINASGKTTLLRLIELTLGITSGIPLSSLNADIFPIPDMISNTLNVNAVFEHDGKFHLIESHITPTNDSRIPLQYEQETLYLNHGRMSRNRINNAIQGNPDKKWTIESTRTNSQPADRSISRTISNNTSITSNLPSTTPLVSTNPATPVIRLFDNSIEQLSTDNDSIHLRFKGDTKDRNLSSAALASIISAGTLRGETLLMRVLDTLKNGGYLLVDELEHGIGRQIVFAIIDLFASPLTNPHGATMIFTTHYPELLDHFTRKDGIWFTVRHDNGFRVENLGDHISRIDIKKSVYFFANQVKGTAPSYQAIRSLREYVKEYVNAR